MSAHIKTTVNSASCYRLHDIQSDQVSECDLVYNFGAELQKKKSYAVHMTFRTDLN